VGPTGLVREEEVSFALEAAPRPAAALPDDAPVEPHFAAIPASKEPAEPARIDPARAAAAEPETLVRTAARRTILPFALLASIGLHLLPLAALVDWHIAPAKTAAPIPVQLVIVQPPAPPPRPPPVPAEKKTAAPGRLASEDMGNPAAKQPRAGSETESSAPQAPTPPAPTEMVSALPPPPVAAVLLPLPTDQPEAEQQAMLPPPRPRPATPPAMRREARPREAAHLGVLGPSATRDEYLAYCDALIQRHLDMLSPSLLQGRSGVTIVSLLVADDGRIDQVQVNKSSGYPDIDRRAVEMVKAVGRFPPVPLRLRSWSQLEDVGLNLLLPFERGVLVR
jgi:TonB family protein